MNQIKHNVKESFKLVKEDIIHLQKEIIELNLRQQKIMDLLNKIDDKASKKVKSKTTKKVYVASKAGKKFHVKSCPFAKNIKPKSKITFKSKNDALNKGYKPCNCI
jgi:hypothetical protein